MIDISVNEIKFCNYAFYADDSFYHYHVNYNLTPYNE